MPFLFFVGMGVPTTRCKEACSVDRPEAGPYKFL